MRSSCALALILALSLAVSSSGFRLTKVTGEPSLMEEDVQVGVKAKRKAKNVDDAIDTSKSDPTTEMTKLGDGRCWSGRGSSLGDSGVSFSSCRESCMTNSKCLAFQYYSASASHVKCRLWDGKVQGLDNPPTAGAECYVKACAVEYNLDGRGGDHRYSGWALGNACGSSCNCAALCASAAECTQGTPYSSCTATHHPTYNRCYCKLSTSTAIVGATPTSTIPCQEETNIPTAMYKDKAVMKCLDVCLKANRKAGGMHGGNLGGATSCHHLCEQHPNWLHKDRNCAGYWCGTGYVTTGADKQDGQPIFATCCRAKRNFCHWEGKAPFCKGECKSGYVKKESSSTGDGKKCLSGKKVFCCSA